MPKKPTYEELEQKVKELEKGPFMKARFGDRFQILSLAIEQSSEGIAVVNMDGNLEYLNEAFAQMHGYSAEELIGKNLSIFHTPHQMPSVEAANLQLTESGEFKGEIWHVRRDGTIFPTLMHNSLVRNDAGKPIGMIGTIRDITDMKQADNKLRESEERHRLFFENCPIGIIHYTSEGTITAVNDAMIAIFGSSRDKLIGLNIHDIPHKGLSEAVSKSLNGELGYYEGEYTSYTGGKYSIIKNTSIPIIRNGGVIAGVGIIEDTTERRQTDDLLRESEQRYRSLFENMLNGFAYCQMLYKDGRPYDFIYLDVNKAFGELTGLQNIVGKRVAEAIPGIKEETPELFDIYARVAETGSPEQFEINFTPLGIWLNISVYSPKKGYFVAVFENITDRLLAAEALRESEEKYRSLITNIPDVTWTSDYEGKTIFISPNVENVFGYTPEEIYEGDNNIFPERIHPEDAEKVEQAFKQLFEKGTMFDVEYRIQRKDGEWIWAHDSSIAVYERDGVKYADGIFSNITSRKQSEEALIKSETKYKGLIETALDGYVMTDIQGKILDCNKAYLDMLGYTMEEIKKLSYQDITPEKWHKMEEEIVEDQFIKRGYSDVFEKEYIRKDGTVISISIRGRLIRDEEGMPIGMWGFTRDITERKQAEEALQESEEKYRSMMEAMIEPIYISSMDFQVQYMNPAMIRRTGRDATGEFCFKALHDLEEKCPWCMHDKAQQGEYSELEIVSPKDNRSYHISQSPIAHGDGSVSKLTIFRDITEMRETEAQLHRAQKMEAMGLLAGGVAHDLNNILSGIVSYPELLLMDLPEDSPLRKPIKTIQESGMRAADVVEDLLTIARGIATGKEALNLNTLITEYLESPEYRTLEKTHSFVNFKTELDPDLLNMSGSPTHIKKTLMNLVVNASEAIEGTGTVTISTMSRYLDEPLKGYEDVRAGEYAVLSVSDDGSGITPKDLDRIFEPFYTKKVMGRSGTGLGLAVVWNTVQDHNGYINVNTSKKGTVFELYFPVTRKEVAAEREEVPLKDYFGHGEKILVVDDEERQREIACGILTKLGYNPEAVSSGEEAIEYMKENAVDLIVLDMVMPKGINGRKTYEEIIKIRPGQKAIIASGYAKTKEVDIAQRLGAGKYIKKPYILEKIGIAVKEELER